MTMKKLITLSICACLAVALTGCGKPSKKEEKGGSGLSAEGSHIQIISIQDGGGLKDEGFKAAADALQSNPDIRGIFAINDPSALGAHAALKQKDKVGQVTRNQLEEIAKTKMPDLTAYDMDQAVRIIAGSARSMGIETEEA